MIKCWLKFILCVIYDVLVIIIVVCGDVVCIVVSSVNLEVFEMYVLVYVWVVRLFEYLEL